MRTERGIGRHLTFVLEARVLGIADLAGATLGLLIGGILAAPLGAWAAKHFPPKQMLILVGVVLTLTSAYGVWSAWG